MDGPDATKLRALPQVQSLLETPQAVQMAAAHGRPAVLAALRHALHEARASILRGDPHAADGAHLLAAAAHALHQAPHLTRVINATGIVLHTNLGRAPLAAEAIQAAIAAAGYTNLEYDLATGARGSRMHAVEPLLCAITGAEAALAVNNNAAGMLLALTALGGGGEVIVSRGELVEIGGGFRIPDVIQQGGARLVEVGTTNKTRLADYHRALTPQTRLLLKVHPGNFRMVGFTAATSRTELVQLAHAQNLLVVEDFGSGALTHILVPHPPAPPLASNLPTEDRVQDAVSAGVDVIAFSADKLLGGPQAGLLVGRAAAIDLLRRHPLMRALRLDKLTLAALEATLRLHRSGATANIPALRMLGQSQPTLNARAERLAAMLAPYARIEPSHGEAGGGTLPAQPIRSIAVVLTATGLAADDLAARLRQQHPPVIGRIAQGCVRLDMLTVADADLDELAASVHAALDA